MFRGSLVYLKAARGLSEQSIDCAAKALQRFEASTRFRDFRKFHVEQAVAFRRVLGETKASRGEQPLSYSTMMQTLNALRSFFIWLADRPGYKSKICYSDADYFRLSEKETRVARTAKGRALTGARDGALVSLKLKHVDLSEGKVVQDGREVSTKFSKTFTTWFFPVGDDVRSVVEEWIKFLRERELFSDDDPLFPATAVVNGRDRQFEVAGLSRNHWANTGPVRDVFRKAFAAAGLPYFNPHSFRNTLAQLSQRRCRDPEAMKAWSQNLGHEDVLTTFRSYGAVAADRQAEIIRNSGEPDEQKMAAQEAVAILKELVNRVG
jgi:integrase